MEYMVTYIIYLLQGNIYHFWMPLAYVFYKPRIWVYWIDLQTVLCTGPEAVYKSSWGRIGPYPSQDGKTTQPQQQHIATGLLVIQTGRDVEYLEESVAMKNCPSVALDYRDIQHFGLYVDKKTPRCFSPPLLVRSGDIEHQLQQE